jgi:hypothetical protein
MATDGQDGNPERWEYSYRAALLEFSIDRLPQRIRDVQKEIVGEIECSGGSQIEQQPNPDALCALEKSAN